MVHFVYILRCHRKCGNPIFNDDYIYYRGYTNNIQRRMMEHKKGKSKYTKQFNGNIYLVYLEEIIDRDKKNERNRARKREKEIKRWSRNKVFRVIGLRQDKINALIHKYFDSKLNVELGL